MESAYWKAIARTQLCQPLIFIEIIEPSNCYLHGWSEGEQLCSL